MSVEGRATTWLSDLLAVLDQANELVVRGHAAFLADPALPLAFEALVNRVGDLSKRLVATDPQRFSHPVWRAAARTRDFVVHHYDRVDLDLLWQTVAVSFPQLREERGSASAPGPPL
mgnify:CR=1 FL=1